MINTHGRSISIMVMFAIALHLVWSVLIFVDDATVNATAVHALYRYIHPSGFLALVVLVAALSATVGIFTRRPWIVLLLMPQQILLMMSAAGCVEAIWIAQFADGVIRSRAFLAADQIYSMLAAIGHTVAIIIHTRKLVR